METITITLNGREVSGYAGMTVLELARESGIDIPTLCYDPHLPPAGACRICIVEDERNGALMASCVTPIAPGMVINTHSPRVMAHRETIIKLMLASHPDSCLVCDKGNRCQLRQIAADMGIGWVELERIPQRASIEEVNPFIERDLSKCILCARCIRACQELVVQGAIDYYDRGFTSKVATLNDMPLENSECTFCGTCVAMCPTGALMEKEKDYRGTTKAATETTCPFCGCGCSISLEVKDNHLVRATPGKEDTVNYGALCIKGSYGYDFVHSPDRLSQPLIKGDEGWQETSWEQALEEAAGGFQRLKEEYGPDSLAVFGSSKCTNEENYLLQRFARCVLGTNNIDNGSRLYNAATRIGLNSTAPAISPGYIKALEQSEVIILIGTDPASSAPVVEYAIKRAVKNQGAKLILIGTRQPKLAAFAHLWLKPKAGTETALLSSLAKVIITEGTTNEDSTSKIENYQTWKKSLAKFAPEKAAAITGVPSEEIRIAARLYSQASQATIVYGSGITQNNGGADNVRALVNLSLLTGRTDGIYALQDENNGRGACDMGALPDFLPGYGSVSDTRARKRFAEKWQVTLPSEPGLTILEIIEQIKAGNIKGLYVVGENPALSLPESTRAAEALASLEFLVVQDMFLTETAGLANVVLPAASFAEKDGSFTNFEGRVSPVRKAIEPIGDSLPDWEIILRLANKMGNPLPFATLDEVREEIKTLVPEYLGTAEVAKPKKAERALRFAEIKYNPPPAELKDGYPYTLITGAILQHFGSGTRSSRAHRLNAFCPHSFIEINQSDAQELGINQNDQVKIISPVAELSATVRINNDLPEGTVFLPMSFRESPAAKLFKVALDPETKTPSLRTCNVKLERIALDG